MRDPGVRPGRRTMTGNTWRQALIDIESQVYKEKLACTVIVVQPTLTHEPPRAFEADRGMGRSYCKQHTGDEPDKHVFRSF